MEAPFEGYKVDKKIEAPPIAPKPQEFDSSTWTGRGASPEKSPELKTEEVAKEAEAVPAAAEARKGRLSGFLRRASEGAERIEAFSPSNAAEKLIGKGKEAVAAGHAICTRFEERVQKADQSLLTRVEAGKAGINNKLANLDKRAQLLGFKLIAPVADRVSKAWNTLVKIPSIQKQAQREKEKGERIAAESAKADASYETEEIALRARLAQIGELRQKQRDNARGITLEHYAEWERLGNDAEGRKTAVSFATKEVERLQKTM